MTHTLTLLLIHTRPTSQQVVKQWFGRQKQSVSIIQESRLNKVAPILKEDDTINAIILDTDLKDPMALEMIEGIRDLNDQIPLLLLAESHEHTAASNALMAGADNYVVKGRNEESLGQQITHMMEWATRPVVAGV